MRFGFSFLSAQGRIGTVGMILAATCTSAALASSDSTAKTKVEAKVKALSGESTGATKINLRPVKLGPGEKLIEGRVIVSSVPTSKRLSEVTDAEIPILSFLTDAEVKAQGLDEALLTTKSKEKYLRVSVSQETLSKGEVQTTVFDALDTAYAGPGYTYVYADTPDRVGAALALHSAARRSFSHGAALELGRKAGLAEWERRVLELLPALETPKPPQEPEAK